MQTKIKNFVVAALIPILILTISIPYTVAKGSSMTCFSTISGLNTFIEIKSGKNEQGTVTINRPNNSKIILIESTDSDGYIYKEIDDFYLKNAGKYTVNYQDDSSSKNLSCSFEVYPGEPDLEKSKLTVEGSKIAIANGTDSINIKLKLLDSNDNPISDYSVNFIPSRKEDNLSMDNFSTDEDGVITASVSSELAGKSVISVFDPVKNEILKDRIEIVFVKNGANAKETGGYFGYASIFDILKADSQEYSDAAKFNIEGLEEDVVVGEAISLKVTVEDEDDNTVLNYSGSILFSTSDEDAVIPSDAYEFKEEDSGSHTFNLSFKFFTEGEQTLEVSDTENYDLKSSIKFNVVSEDNVSSDEEDDESELESSDEEISISSPSSGTYSGNVNFSGSAPKSTNLIIYANEKEVATVKSDEKGIFNKSINFENGLYTIYIATDEDADISAQSEELSIKVDSNMARVDEIKIEPQQIKSGDTVFISILSEADLAQVSIIINDQIIDLTPSADKEGEYSGKLAAPSESGSYKIDAILVNELGEEAIYSEVATIDVDGKTDVATSEDSTEVIDESSEETEETTAIDSDDIVAEVVTDEPVSTPSYPSQVTGFEISSVEDGKITLSWEVANAASEDKFIQNYRIYYSTDSADLKEVVDTFDSSTKWYIPNLENGQTYYFKITAIDSEGLESDIPSEIISAIPASALIGSEDPSDEENSDELHDSASEIDEEEDINIEENVDEVPESGPSAYIILLTTLILTDIYIRVRKKFLNATGD